MASTHDTEYLVGLVHELRALPQETEWVEFKLNKSRNQDIGEYVSALSNGAALRGKTYAYLVWGIDNETHAIKGTNFDLAKAKQGNELLENWLLRGLNPEIEFRFYRCRVDARCLVILEISRAFRNPVAFGNERFIRVSSVQKNLRDHPESVTPAQAGRKGHICRSGQCS